LKTNDLGFLIAGLVALIATFLPWYTVSFDFDFGQDLGIPGSSGSDSAIGWETGAGVLAALLILLALAFVAARAFGISLPKMPFPASLIAVVLAGLATVIVLLRWLTFDSADGAGSSIGPDFGIIVCFIALVVMTAFAVMSMLAEMKGGAKFGSSGQRSPAYGGGPGGGPPQGPGGYGQQGGPPPGQYGSPPQSQPGQYGPPQQQAPQQQPQPGQYGAPQQHAPQQQAPPQAPGGYPPPAQTGGGSSSASPYSPSGSAPSAGPYNPPPPPAAGSSQAPSDGSDSPSTPSLDKPADSGGSGPGSERPTWDNPPRP